MNERLQSEAGRFAGELTELVQNCIPEAPPFESVEHGDRLQRRIGPQHFNLERQDGFDHITLRRRHDGKKPPLSLQVEFSVSMDDEFEHLAVSRSVFGLWVRSHPRHKPRPVFRIEYDRDARNKPPVHVHIHAESHEFGWVYGSAGLRSPRLHEIHFPLGGRRFRPTVEDVFRFLHREKLYEDWCPGWDEHVERSSQKWERNQAKATVRRNPETAMDQLLGMGYEVKPPVQPSSGAD